MGIYDPPSPIKGGVESMPPLSERLGIYDPPPLSEGSGIMNTPNTDLSVYRLRISIISKESMTPLSEGVWKL